MPEPQAPPPVALIADSSAADPPQAVGKGAPSPAGSICPSDRAALAPATRRWLYLLLIGVAGAQGLAHLWTASVVYSPARWPENRPPHTLMFSANDRSRWCTVWSLVERGTYQIDEIIQQPGWDTIDKVRFEEHFYSSKPPLLSTLVSGLYWTLKQLPAAEDQPPRFDLVAAPHETVRWLLLVVNWLPWLTALVLLAGLVERYAQTDWSRLFVVLAAATGTFLTTFLVTFNNHSVAASSVVFALSPALRIVIDGGRRWWWFALAGFWGAFAACNELPACALGLALFVLLFRAAPRQTLTYFVPAAILPLAAFLYTNWLCTGSIKPFYASFGAEEHNYYKYILNGIPSYWMNPSAIDKGESSAWVYLFHCTLGHHGILSLSPMFLLTVAGWWRLRRRTGDALRGVSLLGLVLTGWVLGFYLWQTQSYNYGGMTCGLRWAFWLIPLWLLGLVPVLDAWGHRRVVQIATVGLLAISVYSAAYPYQNPWQHPWLKGWFDQWSPPPAPEPDSDIPPPRKIWLGPFPSTPPTEEQPQWIELVGETPDGQTTRWKLSARPGSEPNRRLVTWEHLQGGKPLESLSMSVALSAWQKGQSATAVLPAANQNPTPEELAAQRFLNGLPRPATYKPGPVRFLKTALRKDAFACHIAGASVSFQPRKKGPALRYRRMVWWSPEVPLGVLQIEDTVTDPRDNSTVYRQRLTAVRVSGLIDVGK
ncbi:MAG: hypothetical protein ACKV0T_27790 [Planctomycetales bacterium]